MKLDNYGVITHKDVNVIVHMYNGLPHFIGGPSIEKTDGTKMFHIMGHRYDEDEYWEIIGDAVLEMI